MPTGEAHYHCDDHADDHQDHLYDHHKDDDQDIIHICPQLPFGRTILMTTMIIDNVHI